MTAQPRPYITEAEYLELERAGTSKHEYFAGDIFAMTGASEQHSLIASNVVASLHQQMRGRSCRMYPSDMRLKVDSYRGFGPRCDLGNFIRICHTCAF